MKIIPERIVRNKGLIVLFSILNGEDSFGGRMSKVD